MSKYFLASPSLSADHPSSEGVALAHAAPGKILPESRPAGPATAAHNIKVPKRDIFLIFIVVPDVEMLGAVYTSLSKFPITAYIGTWDY